MGEDAPVFFADNGYIGRGISGQTSAEMLARFRPDVIELAPKTVVILAGTNDIAQNNGPIELENVMDNIASMCELARLHNIRVLLCSVLPAAAFPWREGIEPADSIIRLNAMIEAYARENGIEYVDYHSRMKDGPKRIAARILERRRPPQSGRIPGHGRNYRFVPQMIIPKKPLQNSGFFNIFRYLWLNRQGAATTDPPGRGNRLYS